MSPTKDTKIKILDATIDMSDADFYIEGNGSGGWKCGTANALKGLFRGTIEDLVKEMLRPMLKDWLDTNLPPMVERYVEREIARLTRR